jgi:hypothetical protein
LDQQLAALVRLAMLFVKTFRKGGKIVLFGNGGSAAEAQHVAAEFIGRTPPVTFVDVLRSLSPLLGLYVLVIFAFSQNSFMGDEGGYTSSASNLTHGFYSPPNDVDLLKGPGYSLLLTPFAALNLPWFDAKLLNGLMLFSAVVLFYYTLRLYINHRPAVGFTYLLGLYPPPMEYLPLLLTETLAFLLVIAFAYCFCSLYAQAKSRRGSVLGTSAVLAYLALTKIIFGYVIVAGLVISLALYAFRRYQQMRKTITVCVLALLLCLPYLLYTYTLTGKLFYWSASGGQQLYWMASPYAGDLGDWLPGPVTYPQLATNHGDFFASISQLNQVEQDDAMRARAIANIRAHPVKYLENWLANVGRLLFNYPYSYTQQKFSTYFYILPNMFLVVVGLLLVYPTYRRRQVIPYAVYAMLALGLITLFASSLVSAYERQFHVLVPAFAVWGCVALVRVVRITFTEDTKPDTTIAVGSR